MISYRLLHDNGGWTNVTVDREVLCSNKYRLPLLPTRLSSTQRLGGCGAVLQYLRTSSFSVHKLTHLHKIRNRLSQAMLISLSRTLLNIHDAKEVGRCALEERGLTDWSKAFFLALR